jgi:hypothetical protein
LAVVAFVAWDSLRGMTPAHAGSTPGDRLKPVHAHIASGTCGALAVALGVAYAKLPHSAHALTMILLAISAACLVAIAAYCEVAARFARAWLGPWPAVAGAAPVLISGTAAMSFLLYPMIYPQTRSSGPPPPPLPPSAPFSITPGWGVYAPSSGSGLSDLAMVGQYEAGVGLQPINWLVHVTLANNRSAPTTIIGLTATAAKIPAPGGPPEWQRFCNVTLHQQRLFRIYPSLRDTTEYSTADALDGRLVDQPIPAHGTVSGWLAWYCPGHNCGTFAKLTVQEANGQLTQTELFPLSSTAANLHDPFPSPVADHVDLTTQPLAIVDNCVRPETGGLMVLLPHN